MWRQKDVTSKEEPIHKGEVWEVGRWHTWRDSENNSESLAVLGI